MPLPWRKDGALGSRSTALEALRGADLSGKVAVVTGEPGEVLACLPPAFCPPAAARAAAGGNGGVGLETVQALVHAGADVILCSRSVEAGRAAAQQLAADAAVPLKVR